MFSCADEKGSLLVGALIVSILLGIFSISIYLHIKDIIQLRQAEIHSSSAKINSKRLTLSKLSNKAYHSGRTLQNCINGKSTKGKHTISRVLCVTQHDAESVNLQTAAIDFNKIFKTFTSCLKAESAEPNHIFPLEGTSNISSLTCKEVLPDDLIVIDGNLSLAKLALEESCLSSTIAATGYIHINEMDINCDSMLLAGGDIYIESLQSLSESKVRTSLVSGSGAILVPAITGEIEIAAFSSGNISLASAPLQDPPYMLPPLLDMEVLGFTE